MQVNDVEFVLLKYLFDLGSYCVLKADHSECGLWMGLNILHVNSWKITTTLIGNNLVIR